ncbi:MAG: hypothetical protein ACYC1U_01130 [Candidatus Aquicultorales bacterium]
MRNAPRFLARLLVFSLLLFSAAWISRGAYAWAVSFAASVLRGAVSLGTATVADVASMTLMVPVGAAILAAAGLSSKEKRRGLLFLAAAFLAFDSLTVASEMVRIAEEVRAGSPDLSGLEKGVAILYHGLVWVMPFALAGHILDWRWETLWTERSDKQSGRRPG